MFNKNYLSYPLLSILLLLGACHQKPLPKRSIKDKAASLVFPDTLLMLTTTVFLQEQGSLAGCNRASGPANLLLAEDHRKPIPQKPEHTFELYARYNPNTFYGKM